jgi:predicted ATPase
MPKIEGFRIRNFRALKDVTLGRLWTAQDIAPLTLLSTVIGKNGTGKTTLLNAFDFLSDCLKFGVEDACDLKGRGGFARLQTQGIGEPIEFEMYYREKRDVCPITYEISIALDEQKRPFVAKERMLQHRKNQSNGRPFTFLILEDGRGIAWKGEHGGKQEAENDDISNLIEASACGEDGEPEIVELEDNRKLGISVLGALAEYPRISAFRQFIEGWYLSYFTPDAARSLPFAGPQKRLNVRGDNLGNVVQYMKLEHPEKFETVLDNIAGMIPGIDRIAAESTPDGRLLLKFNDRGFQDPFYVQQISDGTLKIFAYLLLLSGPTPPPFLCIEEPESGLYHKLLEVLVQAFRGYVANGEETSQILFTTHHPYLVDALEPEEVWVLEKGENGFSGVHRAISDPVVKSLTEEGLSLGGLWYSDYLEQNTSQPGRNTFYN